MGCYSLLHEKGLNIMGTFIKTTSMKNNIRLLIILGIITVVFITVYILNEDYEVKKYEDLTFWGGILSGGVLSSWAILLQRVFRN